MRKKHWIVATILVCAVALTVGAQIFRYGWAHAVTTRLPYRAVRCPAAAKLVIVAGQSLAANSGRARFASANGFGFDGADCHPLVDPLRSVDGAGGSIWPLVADRLTGPIVFVNGAKVGSSIRQWGEHGASLRKKLAALPTRPTATLFVFMQGEADAVARMNPAEYGRRLASLHRLFDDSPWLLVREQRCAHDLAGWSNFDDARTRFAASKPGVLLGPSIDDLTGDYRGADGCHLTYLGQKEVALRIARAIRTVPGFRD